MRKTTTIFLLLLFSLSVIAQKTTLKTTVLDESMHRQKAFGHSSNVFKSAKSMTVSVELLNKYLAGTTMDLRFSLTLETPDLEYADYFELTFPEGITPISGTDPIATPTELQGGQIPCDLNPIDGQTISWGDNNNAYGGIEPGIHEFTVKVQIDDTVSVDYELDYNISGDEYGAAPHEYSGKILLMKLPDVPDLTIMPTGFVNEYYSVPFEQVSFTVQAMVVNKGNTLTEATKASASSANGFSSEKNITLPLSAESSEVINFGGYQLKDNPRDVFTFKANASNDFNETNSTGEAIIGFNDTALIRDNGDIAGYFGVSSTAANGVLANLFTLNLKDTLNSVTFYLGSPTNEDKLKAVVYLFDEENGPTYQLAVSNELQVYGGEKEYTAFFGENGVVLEPGKYLIGIKEDINVSSLAYTTTPYIEGSSYVYMDHEWSDLGEMGYPLTFYIRPGFGTKVPAFDIELLSVDIPEFNIKNTDIPVSIKVANNSIEELDDLTIGYIIDDNEPVVETLDPKLTGQSIKDITLSSEINLPVSKEYQLKVYISDMNGGVDTYPDNDTLTLNISAQDYAPNKRVLGEEATGTWCGWCVRGHVYMDSMALKYPDTWIGVAVHNNDPMVVAEYDQGIGNYIAGYPSGLVNRAGEYDPSEFEMAYLEQIKTISPVDLSVENCKLDENTGEISVELSADFLANVRNARFNAIVIEHEVTGTSAGFNQANYYASGDYGPMAGYENMDNPVLAKDMVYKHVASAIAAGWDGAENSLPELAETGNTETYTFTIPMNKEWSLDNIDVVGIIFNGDGTVLNATKSKVTVGINDISLNRKFKAYPNPFNQQITITNTAQVKRISLFNILGEQVETKMKFGNENIVVSSHHLPEGVYFIQITDNENKPHTLKVVKK